jgi:hypothetical protein
MPLAVQMGLLLAFAALLIAHLWRAQWMPIAVTIADAQREGPKRPEEGADEEQLPETDRAPRGTSHLLTYAVALTAAVRLGVLLTLHR